MAIRRYKYKLRHTWLTTAEIGKVTPFFCQEVTPGDTFAGVSAGMIRMEPMNKPVYMSLRCHFNYFFVPHRTVWPEFEDVITGADTSTAWPVVTPQQGTFDNILRFLGLGPATTTMRDVNALPLYAYNSICNEHYSDTEDGDFALTYQQLRQAQFPPNGYFSGARTDIQQGNEETVDSSGPTLGVTEIRDAFHRQKFKERRSQYGDRYTDYLRAVGLSVPDSRLDRPEHVASGRTTVGISEVINTGSTITQGDLVGHGISGVRIKFPKRVFLEHGTLMGLFVARPRQMIKNRIDRQFYVEDKDDLFQPELARDTQVALRGGEIASEDDADHETVVGYVPRDEWLRTARDVVAGKMQDTSNAPWVAAQDFGATAPNLPTLRLVPTYDTDLFKTSSPYESMKLYFEHGIGKRSIVPRRVK